MKRYLILLLLLSFCGGSSAVTIDETEAVEKSSSTTSTSTTTSTLATTNTVTTTTTTIPEGVVAYLEEITGEKIQVIELGKKVLETNQRWDDKVTSYQEAQQEFQEFIDDFDVYVQNFTNPGPPSSANNLVSNHQELIVIAELIFEDTKELLEGLTAPDTGERRNAALDSFNSNLDLFIQRIEQTVASATSS